MARGKHSSDWGEKRNSFDDYTENNDDNYERNINYAESNFFDEDEEEFDYKKILITVATIIVLIIVGVLIYKFIIKKPEKVPNEPVITDTEKMSETIDGYKVLGKIVIKDLNIDQYILDSTESKALQKGVGKIDNGASINNYGNFCLAGHNNEKIFQNLNKLKVDDEFVLVDKKMEETIYKVTSIFEVEPDNLECLLQDESKIEVTLITCQEGATKRLVIRAQEKSNLSETSNNVSTNTVSTDGEKDI